MQICFRKLPSRASGFVLLITLIFLAVALMVFASIFYWTSSNAKITLRNNQYNMSQAAAEAASETVMSYMMRDYLSQSVASSPNAYAFLPGTNIDQSTWPVKYQFSDTNGNPGQISVWIGPTASNSVALDSQYSGLYGFAQNFLLIARATPINQPETVSATIDEAFQTAYIPLFQFAIFYNVNLEIDPGASMTIGGPVFCDQSIWEGSSVCTFSTNVTAVGTNDTARTDPFANNYTGSGTSRFLMAGQPVDHANSLTMPIGTNNDPATVISLLELPPANYSMGTAAAYTTNGQVYLANKADLVISNAAYGTNFGSWTPTGTNITVYYQDKATTFYLNPLSPDFYILKTPAITGRYTNYVTTDTSAGLDCNTNVQYAGFSFLTNNIFYDYREGKTVQAVELDVSKFNLWVTNTMQTNCGGYYNNLCMFDKGSTHPIDGIYIYNSVPETGSTLPAVRLVNGQTLPSSAGLTVVTPFPMYVKGDYNVRTNATTGGNDLAANATSHTYPAALMADSITILSSSWNDTIYTSSYGLSSRSPAQTTINAAMLEGIVPSNPAIRGNYSGGVENFMRLEENWSGVKLWYNGAIVVLFYSQYATNSWSYGSYYDAPTREWAFDANFEQELKLPPMTPQAKAVIRGQWAATAQ